MDVVVDVDVDVDMSRQSDMSHTAVPYTYLRYLDTTKYLNNGTLCRRLQYHSTL